MPHGGAGRTRPLVEVDDALLGRDEQRERGDGLRDGRERQHAVCVSLGHGPVAGSRDAGGGERHRPGLDLAKCLHAARY